MNYEQMVQRIAELDAENRARPRMPIYGVEVSYDHGKNWRLVAICEKCLQLLEPPVRAKKGMKAGVYSCDWCEVINDMYPAKE